MADDFTAKFKVDISDLKKNITEANKQIKLANATFKAETAGMDKWSKDADGLSKKLDQLKSVLENQKKILASYEDQLKRQNTAYEENGKKADALRSKLQELADNGIKKTDEEYKKYSDALKDVLTEQAKNEKACDSLKLSILEQKAAVGNTEREIRNYSANLDDLKAEAERAADASEDLADATDEAAKSAGKADGGFTVMKGALADLVSKGITAAVNGMKKLAQATYDAWQEYDRGADAIIATTGATGEAAEGLMKVYQEVSRRVVGDLGDIGEAVGEVNTRFDLTGAELEQTTEQFLKFAKVNDTDVKSAVDNVQAAMAAWGLEAKDAGALLDTLTKAGQETGTSVDEITAALTSNAPALQEMGLSASDAALFVARLNKNGIEASSVMTGMKKALQNAAKEGKPLDEAMADVEQSIRNAATQTEALTIASELFGSKAGPAIATAVRDGRLSFQQLGTSLNDFSGNLDTTYNAMLDAPDKIGLALQNLRVEAAKVFEDFLDEHGPQIEQTINTITENTVAFVRWISANGPTVAAVIGSITAALVTYTAATKGAAAAQAVLNAVLSANPIGLVIAAIAALVAAFVILWNKSEAFRKFWIELWDKIKSTAKSATDAVKKWFAETWADIKAIWFGVGEWFAQRWEDIKNVFAVVGEWFSQTFTDAWERIKAVFAGWGAFFGDLWETAKRKFTDFGSKIGEAIGDAVKSGINSAITLVERTLNKGINLINGAIDLINKIPGVNVDYVSPVSLPRLAKGGVLKRGQIGLLEGTGAEAVVPLERNKAWIKEVARDMSAEMSRVSPVAARGAINNDTAYNFTQNIYAPAQPSRIELYRQTRNLLAFASGVE